MSNSVEIHLDGHICLKKIEISDLHNIKKWKNDKRLSELILSKYKKTSMQDVRAWYQKNMNDTDQILLGIYLVKEKRLIGIVRIMFINWQKKEAEVGLYIGDGNDRGKGYGSKSARAIINHMFEKEKFVRLYLKVSQSNAAAVQSYRNLGFVKEKDLENGVVLMGIYN